MPDLELDQTRRQLQTLKNGGDGEGGSARAIQQAEQGLEMLQALEKEGYSI
jgi:hypothetical protein